MANITPGKEPQFYVGAVDTTWSFSANVDKVSYSVNGLAPAISKYIAYDTLTPPGPFIAVTQDGAGNVVYDGGFPKFYNSQAPSAGIDSLFSMEYKGTRVVGATPNTYYYDAFNDLSVTIAAGDKLVYDIWMNSPDARAGIDAITAVNPNTSPAIYSLRDWGTQTSVLKDQNGISPHPASDLSARANNTWYHREFDLTACAGHTFIRWSLAYEGEIPGTFYTRFKEVYILDSRGRVKATLFKDTIKLPNSTSTEAGASGYTDTAKYIYDPRSHLTASFKYLFNAIRWCANPKKPQKVLILGDQPAAFNYAVKSTADSGFFTSFTNLCNAVNFVPTFKDINDYGGVNLNATLTELNQYACIIVVGSSGGPNAKITDSCVQNIQTFRQQGGGVILITDDGPDIPNIGAAYPPPPDSRQFFITVNKIAVNFGAYFTGLYDRTPVNVGFLRATYGDHPLYSGMLDSESIVAGGSESNVVVTPFTQYNPGAVPTINLSTVGENTVNFLLLLKDGTIESYKFKYTVVAGEFLFNQNSRGQQLAGYHDTSKRVWDGGMKTTLADPPTILGDILRNNVRMGSFTFEGGVTTYKFLAGPRGFAMEVGDVITHALTAPYLYKVASTVRNPSVIAGKLSQAQVRKQLVANEYSDVSATAAFQAVTAMAKKHFMDRETPSPLQTWPQVMGPVIRMLTGGPVGAAQFPVYTTTAATLAAMDGPLDTTLFLLDASTKVLYWFVNDDWVASGQTLTTALGVGRLIVSTAGNGTWRVDAGNVLTKVA